MSLLKEKFKAKLPKMREEIRKLIKDHGDKVISEVTVRQAYGGMRGVKGLVCDTSLVDPDQGLSIRGTPIIELTDKRPEDIFCLLLTGELPTEKEAADMEVDIHNRHYVPFYVWEILRKMPKESHPMTMFSTAIMVLQRDSVFGTRYADGLSKEDFWEATFEDSMNLLAKVPILAGGIYRIRFDKGQPLKATSRHKDWAGAYAESLGLPDFENQLTDCLRLYLVLHSDHEGGNVSANTCHTVGSALSDPYLSIAAGLNGLAGPLHGLANQECLKFVHGIRNRYGGIPTEDQIREYAWELLNSGRVIPGFGHAVLRVTDPRFTALYEFGKRTFPDDEIFSIVDRLFKVIPSVLKEHGKAANPWPNVDCVSGSLLYHFGLVEYSYYTVVFGVSRIMGMLAQLIINRSLGTPITRPKSVPTGWIKQFVTAKKEKEKK